MGTVRQACREILLVVFCVLLGGAHAGWAVDNWPQWRGPAANGVAAGEDYPLKWSATENVVWKLLMVCLMPGIPRFWMKQKTGCTHRKQLCLHWQTRNTLSKQVLFRTAIPQGIAVFLFCDKITLLSIQRKWSTDL